MATKVKSLLRIYLIFGAVYLLCDSLIHLFNLRLADVGGRWSQDALAYAWLLNQIYASFVILVASLALVIQTNLEKYKLFVRVSGIWSLFHSILLIFAGRNLDLGSFYTTTPSLTFWLPFYNQYLYLEALLLLGYFILSTIYLYKQKND
jgi:hypothetical protein